MRPLLLARSGRQFFLFRQTGHICKRLYHFGVLPQYSTVIFPSSAVQRNETAKQCPFLSLSELHSFFYDTSKEEYALEPKKPREFRNRIVNNVSEMEYKRHQYSSVVQYSPTNNLLMEYLVNKEVRVSAGICRASLKVWIEQLLVPCNLDEQVIQLLALLQLLDGVCSPRAKSRSELRKTTCTTGKKPFPFLQL